MSDKSLDKIEKKLEKIEQSVDDIRELIEKHKDYDYDNVIDDEDWEDEDNLDEEKER
tara:strand:- start:48 stop:218 length:171 start_codon:yes stop_codon:yes gene_type:complete